MGNLYMNEDKKVLVTGASGGIGRACAVEAAKAGYYVICHYNGSKGKAEETLAQIEAAGGKGELSKNDGAHNAYNGSFRRIFKPYESGRFVF